jgi:starch synthase
MKRIKRKLKILMLSAEMAPFAKEGGLADVVGALPKALAKLNTEVKIFIPLYGFIDKKKFKINKFKNNISLEINNIQVYFDLFQNTLPGSNVEVFFIKHKIFNTKKIYSSHNIALKKKFAHKLIDTEKFVFFSKAVLKSVKEINFPPDIIHCHDWHAAIIPSLLKSSSDDFFVKTKTVYTIHNLAHQGIARPTIVGFSKLDPNLPIIKADLKNKDINFMVQGILGADIVNTVSPTYAKEILTHYQGAGLDKILRERKKDLYGILNGIDIDLFNPATDRNIKEKFSAKTLSKKVINKLDLQRKLGLPQNKDVAMVGLISRLVWQKGIELITKQCKGLNCQFVFLGTGQPRYEKKLEQLTKKFSKQFSAQITFDNKLAQQIYAGADIFLMPSRFEPCGLGQMIAMRYGTVPVVRATGGLADTVDNKVGFSFKEFSAQALYWALQRALDVCYYQPQKWQRLQINGMQKDFSWDKSAKEYLRLYRKIMT